jgi:hypothetical protein
MLVIARTSLGRASGRCSLGLTWALCACTGAAPDKRVDEVVVSRFHPGTTVPWDGLIGPAGYPGTDGRSYNFQQAPFGTAPHGSAIALLGGSTAVEGVVIGSEQTFTAALSGPLRVGINDTDPANNKDWISFEGVTRAPTVDEWLGKPTAAAH